MDGWLDAWMNRGWVMIGCMDRQMDDGGCMHGWVDDGWMHAWMAQWIGGWIDDGWMYGWMMGGCMDDSTYLTSGWKG